MKPYACFNRVRLPFYWAPARMWGHSRGFKMGTVCIKDRGSQGCQYSKTTIDPRCSGCIHHQQEMTNEKN